MYLVVDFKFFGSRLANCALPLDREVYNCICNTVQYYKVSIIIIIIFNLCVASKQLIEPIVAYTVFPCEPGVECQELVFEVPQE